MTQVQDAIGHANQAMRSGDFEAALASLRALNLATLKPQALMRTIEVMSQCLAEIGHGAEIVPLHREALATFAATGQTNPQTTTAAAINTALMLSVGARDSAAVCKYLRFLMGAEATHGREFKVSPLSDVRTWCRMQGIEVEILDSAEGVVIDDDTGFGKALRYRSDETWHAVISDAEIIGGWDYIIAPTGEVLDGANYIAVHVAFAFMPHAYYEALNLVAHVWSDQVRYIDEDVLFLSTPERHHYGHWITDFLSRLRAWKEFDNSPRKLAISSQLPRKHRDLLACFGVSSDDLIECDPGQRYRFRSLRVVKITDAAAPNPRNVRFLYDAFGPPASARPRDGKEKRFFLVRDMGTRMIENREEVDEVFQELGITTVNPAKLSYAEQKEILADASLVIAAFGTELYCIYNMRPGSAVIELIWDIDHATVYGPISYLLGMRHHLILCETSDRPARTGRNRVDQDLIVDCATLRRHLTAAVASTEA